MITIVFAKTDELLQSQTPLASSEGPCARDLGKERSWSSNFVPIPTGSRVLSHQPRVAAFQSNGPRNGDGNSVHIRVRSFMYIFNRFRRSSIRSAYCADFINTSALLWEVEAVFINQSLARCEFVSPVPSITTASTRQTATTA